MKRSNRLVLLVGVFLAVIAFVGLALILSRPPDTTTGPNAIPTVLKTVTAVKDIPLGETVTADMVTEGAVVIDVGITRVPDASKKSGFRISGDVDYENVAPKCSYITPVPGGVGPMTIAALLKNTFRACALKHYDEVM